MPRVRSASFRALLGGMLAAMLRSLGLRPPSSSEGEDSVGVGRSLRGRLVRVGRRGERMGMMGTGVGEREGSFSAFSSFSGSESSSSVGCEGWVVGREIEREVSAAEMWRG